MRKFETGTRYTMRSICDHECVWTYEVIKRTAQTITLYDGKEEKTVRIIKSISEHRGAESVMPLGRYSLAPILTA